MMMILHVRVLQSVDELEMRSAIKLEMNSELEMRSAIELEMSSELEMSRRIELEVSERRKQIRNECSVLIIFLGERGGKT